MKSSQTRSDSGSEWHFTLMPWIEDEDERIAAIEEMLDAFGVPRDDAASDVSSGANRGNT